MQTTQKLTRILALLLGLMLLLSLAACTPEEQPPVTVPGGPEPADLIDRYGDFELSMEAVWSLKTYTDANGVNCRVI
ncbi:MAG: hypothetical protein IIV17_06335, partial [Clostridia bacterium]|nr:hypothetical protein [Clostridia bacterium]